MIIRKAIKLVLNKLGFDIIQIQGNNRDINALNNNFINLILNYEKLMRSKFGNFPENTKRLELMKDLQGTPPSEAYFIINSMYKTNKIKGDVCEFGVAQGMTSQLIANELMDCSDKILHLFDSFEGLPKPTGKDILKDDIFHLDSMESYAGTMSNPEKLVRTRLFELGFPRQSFKIHKGFIENLIEDKRSFPTSVSFAYVDFDFYEPIKIVLDFLDGVTKKGAIIMVDDYDFFSTGVKTAVDEFMNLHINKYDIYIPEKSFGCFAILTKNND